MACLILGAYQASHDRINRGGDFLNWKPYPRDEELSTITSSDPDKLLVELDEAIRSNEQAHAAAIVARYGSLNRPARPIFDTLLKYAVSEDAPYMPKSTTAPSAKNSPPHGRSSAGAQLIGLARVTASEFGCPAGGMDEACRLMGVS